MHNPISSGEENSTKSGINNLSPLQMVPTVCKCYRNKKGKVNEVQYKYQVIELMRYGLKFDDIGMDIQKLL